MAVRKLQHDAHTETPPDAIRDGLNTNWATAPNNPIEMSVNYNITDTTAITDYRANPLEINGFAQNNGAIRPVALQLFTSAPLCIGGLTNTSFTTEPTKMTTRNAGEFFRYDHTPIKFTDGHSIGDNFEYATAIPLDIDNSHSDNTSEWMYPEDFEKLLQERGLNYWMSASRNHWLPKTENDGTERIARPKFHAYLPLATSLHDAGKFVRYCEWCIGTFNSDPQVKLKSQKLFGYGDNPKHFVRSWDDGRCIDEIVTDADLAIATPAPSVSEPAVLKTPPPLPPMVAHLVNGVPYYGFRDFNGLKQHLKETDRTFELAQLLCGLCTGNKPGDLERHQPCPITNCTSNDDGFYYRPDNCTFHCRKCGFNGDIFDTIGAVHHVTPFVAFDMAAAITGYSSIAEPIEKSTPSIPVIHQTAGTHSGNYGIGNNGNTGIIDNYENGSEDSRNSGNNGNAENCVVYDNENHGNSGNSGNSGECVKHEQRHTEYHYIDEVGNLCYQIVRTDYTDDRGVPCKRFCPVFWNANGNAVYKEPATLYPYYLSEVLQADVVYIVEGEKTVDALRETLITAGDTYSAVTTSQGGAQRGKLWQNFLQRYPAIATKVIRILPDDDAAGVKYARTVATHILEANPTADVKIIELPDIPEGGDYVDWAVEQKENGNNDAAIIAMLFEACEQAPPVTPDLVALWKQSEQEEAGVPKQWQPFPIETLSPLLQSYVTEVSQSIGIDAANNAACTLAIISGTIGRTFQIAIKGSHHEFAAIWVALVAESGLGKSPPLQFARAPLNMLQMEARKQAKEERERYAIALERYKKDKQKPTESEKPIKPIMQRYCISDSTTEKLVSILAENPYGVCLIRDELAAFFSGMDAYRKAKVDRQIYIEAHGGHPICVDRQKDELPLAADTPSVSIIGGVQSDVLRRLLISEPDFMATGFGARFLMVYPPAEPILWNNNEPVPLALTAYERLVDKIISYRQTYTPDEPGVVSLTPEAKALLFEFQNRKACKSLVVSDVNVRYALNKAGMHAARICLILHIAKCAEKDISPTAAVSEETMKQALTLTQWFLSESERVYAMLRSKGSESLEDRDALLIIAKIKGLGGEATTSQLKDCMSKYHCKGGMAALRQQLSEMVAAGSLTVRQKTEGRGRKAEIFCIPVIPSIPIPTIPTISAVPATAISAIPTIPSIPIPGVPYPKQRQKYEYDKVYMGNIRVLSVKRDTDGVAAPAKCEDNGTKTEESVPLPVA